MTYIIELYTQNERFNRMVDAPNEVQALHSVIEYFTHEFQIDKTEIEITNVTQLN